MRLMSALAVLVLGVSTPCVDAQGAPASRQFDFWVGEWDVVNMYWRKGGRWVEGGRATCRVYPVLDGAAIVEHWQGTTGKSFRYGFSVRAFDPQKKRWVLVLNWPAAPDRTGFGSLEGAFTHGRGEFYSSFTRRDGTKGENRYSFSDITPGKFRWCSASSTDGRKTWHTDWIMRFTRRAAALPKLANGPSKEGKLSTRPEARQMDFLKGDFEGTVEIVGEGGRVTRAPATARGEVILEGLAIMDLVDVGGARPMKFFGVSSHPRNGWVRYGLTKHRPVFSIARGSREKDELHLKSARDDDDVQTKIVWSDITKGGYTWQVMRSEDGEPFATVLRGVFRRVE